VITWRTVEWDASPVAVRQTFLSNHPGDRPVLVRAKLIGGEPRLYVITYQAPLDSWADEAYTPDGRAAN